MRKDTVGNRDPGSDSYLGAHRIAKFSSPKVVGIMRPKSIYLFSIVNRQRKIIKVPFKIVRFIADDIAIEERPIDHFPVIKSGDGNHDRIKGICISFGRNVPVKNPEVRKRVMLML